MLMWRKNLSVFVLAFAITAVAPLAFTDAVIRPLRDSLSAVAARIEVIRSAKKELLISALDFEEDFFGDGFLSEIEDARSRGVKVYWLIDHAVPSYLPGGGANGFTPAVGAFLNSIGVEFKTYNQFDWRHPIKSILMRFHDKLIIADRTRKIGGDRNLTGYYYNLGGNSSYNRKHLQQFDDLDIYITNEDSNKKPVPGGVPLKAAQYFVKIFNLDSHSKPLSLEPATPEEVQALRQRVDYSRALISRIFDNRGPHSLIKLPGGRAKKFRIEDPSQVSFVHDEPGLKGKRPGTAEALMSLFDSAEKSIFISTPYLIMTKKLKAHLKSAIARGVEVTIVTSSKTSTDMKILTAGMDHQNRVASDLGAKILEYIGESSLHIKGYVIDGKTSFVGSYNLNGRSEVRDTESGDIIESDSFAEYLRETVMALPLRKLPPSVLRARDRGTLDYLKKALVKGRFKKEMSALCMRSMSLLFKYEE